MLLTLEGIMSYPLVAFQVFCSSQCYHRNKDAQKTLRMQAMVDALRVNTVLHAVTNLNRDDFDEEIWTALYRIPSPLGQQVRVQAAGRAFVPPTPRPPCFQEADGSCVQDDQVHREM
jgi:hypothetical protein